MDVYDVVDEMVAGFLLFPAYHFITLPVSGPAGVIFRQYPALIAMPLHDQPLQAS